MGVCELMHLAGADGGFIQVYYATYRSATGAAVQKTAVNSEEERNSLGGNWPRLNYDGKSLKGNYFFFSSVKHL